MGNAFLGETLSLAISVAGNLSMAGLFLSPAFGSSFEGLPADYGMIIFALEFLNVHSSAVAYNVATSNYQVKISTEFLKRNPKLILVGFYLFAALVIGFVMKSLVLPAYFTIGLISKFFSRRVTQDERNITYLILLLIFSLVLGMRIWPAILFFLFIWLMGLMFIAFPSFLLWRKWVVKRMESLKMSNPRMADPKRQLFRDKLDFWQYSMPLLIFIPLYLLSLSGSTPLPGERFWAILYFPSLAINDAAVFVRAKFYTKSDFLATLR